MISGLASGENSRFFQRGCWGITYYTACIGDTKWVDFEQRVKRYLCGEKAVFKCWRGSEVAGDTIEIEASNEFVSGMTRNCK